MNHVEDLRLTAKIILTVFAALLAVHSPKSNGQQHDSPSVLRGQGQFTRHDLTVYEGIGIEGLELGDPADRIERILGEPNAGSEHYRYYDEIDLRIQLYEGKVYYLMFGSKYQGSLSLSDIGIGDTLADLESAYGPFLERREVADHNAWRLDRIHLVRRGGPKFEGGDASKLDLYDLGMFFFFDKDERIIRFGLSKRTRYALRSPSEQYPRNAHRPGAPSAAPHRTRGRGERWGRSELTVHEGVGLAHLKFGDPSKLVEDFLGPPDAGSERAWRYRDLGITVSISNGKISAFFFHVGGGHGKFFRESFTGALAASGVGIGDSLEDIEAAYGVALGSQEVDSLTKSVPSRILGICPDCTNDIDAIARISYKDIGLSFTLSEKEQIVTIVINPRRQ